MLNPLNIHKNRIHIEDIEIWYDDTIQDDITQDDDAIEDNAIVHDDPIQKNTMCDTILTQVYELQIIKKRLNKEINENLVISTMQSILRVPSRMSMTSRYYSGIIPIFVFLSYMIWIQMCISIACIYFFTAWTSLHILFVILIQFMLGIIFEIILGIIIYIIYAHGCCKSTEED